MSNGNAAQSTGASELTSTPAGLSLRGRIVSAVVKLVVKRWPRGDRPALVRRARRVFGRPNWMTALVSHGVTYEEVQGTDLSGEWVLPDANQFEDKVLLYLHGGGYVSCSPQTHRPLTAALARRLRRRVFAPDYRLAPEFPFPAAVDDATRAYTWLLELGLKPQNIALAGDSAGGGLLLAAMLRLKSQHQPLPACAVCLSPWVDLTGTFTASNTDSCAMFRPEDGAEFAAVYLNGASARTPEASPLLGDMHSFPPLLIQVSSTEMLFDDSTRLHEKAIKSGVESKLHVYPGLAHVWQIFPGLVPEADAALAEIAAFVDARTK